jgi:Holliday junction resolvase
MKPQSAKAKGRNLQKWARDKILSLTDLTPDDVRSTGMGQQGADVQLSTAAQKKFPFAIECKNRAKQQVYTDYTQAVQHSEGTKLIPLLVLKQNKCKPLAVVDAEWLLTIWRDLENRSNT